MMTAKVAAPIASRPRRFRQNPTLDPDAAWEIADINLQSQLNLVTVLVLSGLARGQGAGPPIPDELALRRLHRAGAQYLLPRPGLFRRGEVRVAKAGELIFEAPPASQVRGLMDGFFLGLQQVWREGDALDVCAHAFWSLTRIHPFLDGNGRTAAAFAYACLCLKLGAVLPGRPTLVERLRQDRPGSEKALRATDRLASRSSGRETLMPLKRYLDRLLALQLEGLGGDARDCRRSVRGTDNRKPG